MAREVVLVWATVSGDMYLLGENTYNYQTANRKPKNSSTCPIKCHCNTSTQFSFLPAWHPPDVQRSDIDFPQLHFSSLTLLKPLYFLDGFQSLNLQMGFRLYCSPYSPRSLFHAYEKKCPQTKANPCSATQMTLFEQKGRDRMYEQESSANPIGLILSLVPAPVMVTTSLVVLQLLPCHSHLLQLPPLPCLVSLVAASQQNNQS